MRNSIIWLSVLILPFLFHNCDEKTNLDPVSKLYVISTSGNDTASRRFDACRLKYSFLNPSSNVASAIQQKSLETPFKLWEEAHGYLTFEETGTVAAADIRIIFSDTASFGHVKTTEGLITQEIPALSTIRYFDNKVDIYLRESFDWTVPVLQKVLLAGIGNALGLAFDNNTIAFVSPTDNSTALSLSDSEIANIKTIYSVKCDEWTRVTDLELAKTASYLDISAFSVNGIGYLNIREYGKNYFLTYNPSSGEWNNRPTHFPDYTTGLTGAFTIGDSGYVLYTNDYFSSDLFLRKFNPDAPDEELPWIELARFPEPAPNYFIVFGIKDKAYLIPNHPSSKSLDIWEYNPTTDKWQKLEGYMENDSNIWSLSLGRSGSFVIDNKAYIDLEYRSYGLEYTPDVSPHWQRYSRPALGSGYSFISFSIRGAGYSLSRLEDSPTGRQLFRFEPKSGWTDPDQLKPFPGTGFIVFQMVINNRAYLGTNTGEFWMYTP